MITQHLGKLTTLEVVSSLQLHFGRFELVLEFDQI